MSTIASLLAGTRERVANAAARAKVAGVLHHDVRLVAVSKTKPVEAILEVCIVLSWVGGSVRKTVMVTIHRLWKLAKRCLEKTIFRNLQERCVRVWWS